MRSCYSEKKNGVGLVGVGVDGVDVGGHLMVVVSPSDDGIGIDEVVWMTPVVAVEERAFLFAHRLVSVGMNKLFTWIVYD